MVQSITLCALFALAPASLLVSDRSTTIPRAAERPGVALVGDVLLAIGHNRQQTAGWQRSLEVLVDRVRSTGMVEGDARRRIRVLHEFMHAKILRGTYETSASDPATALAGGPYNCASATALLVGLAREFGVEAYPVSVVGHIWCRVPTDRGSFDVETTCRDWFVLLERRTAPRRADASAGPPAWQEHLHRKAVARPLNKRAFLAVFHYNRGVGLLREGRFPAAAKENLSALWLDWQCEPAYGNLATALGGWSQARPQSSQPRVFSAPAR